MTRLYLDIATIKPGSNPYDEDRQIQLNNVGKINIFLGENNIGKSRLIRAFMNSASFRCSQKSSQLKYAEIEEQAILNKLNFNPALRVRLILSDKSIDDDEKFLRIYTIFRDVSLRHKGHNRTDCFFTLRKDNWSLKEIVSLHKKTAHWLSFQNENNNNNLSFQFDKISNSCAQMSDIITFNADTINSVKNLNPIDQSKAYLLSDSYYIPVPRGIRQLNPGRMEDEYSSMACRDYEVNLKRISTGQKIHEKLTQMLLGKLSSRKLISEYQSWLSKTFFENQTVALTPNQDSKKVMVLLGDDERGERDLCELGDGIQAIINLTFLPFMQKSNTELTQFFIEEPELHLHPGMQRTLIDAWRNMEGVQFFVTTHSNHLVDMTTSHDDVSVFSLRKEQDGSIEIKHHSQDMLEAVELLGARPSSVVLVNATVWVEGPTDRDFLRRLLQFYEKHLEDSGAPQFLRLLEDLHYSFMMIGGSLIAHTSFLDEEGTDLKKVCADAWLITDCDGFYLVGEDPETAWCEWKRNGQANYKKVFWRKQNEEWEHSQEEEPDVELDAARGWTSAEPPAKLLRHILLETNLGDRFSLLPVRELENLHSPEAIAEFVKLKHPDFKAFSHHDGWDEWYLGDLIRRELDAQNIAQEVAYSDPSSKTGRKGSKTGRKGTLTSEKKKDLVEVAWRYYEANGWSSLPEPAQKLGQKLHEFISKKNGGET